MRQSCRRPTARGYTLIETLVGVALSGIVATFGLPQLVHQRDTQAVAASIEGLHAALRMARAQAVKYGVEVSVCARDPAATETEARCASGGKDWSAGWVVFIDEGDRGALDPDDRVLWVHQPVPHAPQVPGTVRYFTFQPSGVSLNAAAHLDFLPHGAASSAAARRVCINKPGRFRVLPAVQACAA